MPVTPDQAQQLASLACAIRPTGARRWDAAGVVAVIGKVRHLALADVAQAVIRAADDRGLETPGAIGNPAAPCWKERRSDRPQPREPYDATRFCHVCSRSSHPANSDHPFESELDYRRRLATDTPKPPLRQHTTSAEENQ